METLMDKKILIIDGHPVYVDKTIGFLQGLTFKNIQLAKTGQEGIKEVQDYKPDLVILSSMLSDMDSLEVCKAIHEQTKGSVKIIVQIGLFAEVNSISKLKDNGADAVLMRKEKDLLPLQIAIEELLFSKV